MEKRKQEEENRKRTEREKREEDERRKREEEEAAKEEKRKSSLKLKDELRKAKTVLFNIEEAPTPSSSTRDSSVYNHTESESDSSNELRSKKNPLGRSTDTGITILVDEDEDGEKKEEGEDGDGDDMTSNDEYSEWIDRFQELTEEEEREDLSDLRTLKVIKVIIYIFLAATLLIALTVQKVSFITLAMELTDGTTKNEKTVAYVMLIFILCIPYAVGFLLSFLKQMFSISKAPSVWTWLWVLSIESLHTAGMCVLVFRAARHLDHFKVAYLLSATASIPSLLKLFVSDRMEDFSSNTRSKQLSWRVGKATGFVADFLAFVVQCSAPAVAILLDFYEGEDDGDAVRIVELVVGLVLVSANQWENFADGTLFGLELREESWFKNKVLKIRFELQECRNFPHSLACLIKIGLTILFAYLLRDGISLDYYNAFDNLTDQGRIDMWAAAIAVTVAAVVAFNVALIALKLQMQRFSFALPLCLATPLSVAVLYLDCRYDFLDYVTVSIISGDGSKSCSDQLMLDPWYNLVIFGVWLASLLVVCRHIWRRQMDKDSNMNRLFLDPVYCGVLTAEQIMLNQRRHQCRVDIHYKHDDNDIDLKSVWYKINRLVTFQSEGRQTAQQVQQAFDEEQNNIYNAANNNDNNDDIENPNANQAPPTSHVTTKLYACATMWHETRTEMVQLLKSLHRLDYDQYLRKINQEPTRYDPNYYEFEAHIFFDDAMERDDDNFPVPNRWVKDLVSAMNEACSSVHCKPMRVHPPVKMVTPYGGQLMWEMPGENLLFVHLKDMDKIRNRKRWSQVMYMYYLLHYRLAMFCQEEAIKRLEEINKRKGEQGLNIDEINMLLGEEHKAQSNKTFVLALDGDTDFLPSSIRMLMQRMDEDTVGATCGRIHPIGKGPMVWYQKFEYAIGHWLQKAAEHVFGCVLCSPGCFSLFRARALMDANVVRRYTTEPTEPSHHLQYDQGEDRWLCTLLLQRGFRIEYAASADAWTFAPEGFFEFFNQRRRWMPSTIANILDLLGTASRTRQVNRNISLPYILYTWLLMFMTLLGPGTILMMMAGAFQLIFTLDITWAYFWSIIPAGLFTLACFWLKSKWQLLIAATLSIGYGFIMVIVIVGTIITATTENIFHPSVIIMVCLLGIFFLTGLFHPKEWTCLLHGILYILCIPSGYLLLVIYSICNLNDVSWGTREVPTKAQLLAKEAENKRKEEEKLKNNQQSWFKRMFASGESHISELTALLKTVVPKTDAANANVKDISQDQSIEQRVSAVEAIARELWEKDKQGKRSEVPTSSGPSSSTGRAPAVDGPSQSGGPKSAGSKVKKDDKDGKKVSSKKDDPLKPRWTQDPGLGKGELILANKDEIKFWKGLMENYLLPIRPTAAEKKKIADGLKDLRNSAAFAFILCNLLWMSLNFMFQLTEAAKVNMTYSFGNTEYHVEESVLGMSFVFLLLILLLLQFAGMVIHRFGVLQQLLATTKIWGKNEDVNISRNAEVEDAVKRIKMILQMPAFNDEGVVTEGPVAAEKNDALGRSVVPSRTTGGLSENLLQSTRAMGAILESTRNGNAVLDPRDADTLDEFRRRLGGSRIQARLGGTGAASFRPNLPPRGNSRHHNRQDATALGTTTTALGGFGITRKELEKMRPGTTIVEPEPEVDRNNPQWKRMGALGKSLNFRATLLQQEQARLRAIWSEADNAAANGAHRGHHHNGPRNNRRRPGSNNNNMAGGHFAGGRYAPRVNNTKF